LEKIAMLFKANRRGMIHGGPRGKMWGN